MSPPKGTTLRPLGKYIGPFGQELLPPYATSRRYLASGLWVVDAVRGLGVHCRGRSCQKAEQKF